MNNEKKKLIAFYQTNKKYFLFARRENLKVSNERLLMCKFLKMGSRVLDVACGTAENGPLLIKEQRCQYVGTDISPKAAELARVYRQNDFVFLISDSEYLPFRDSSFEGVLCTYSLEHFTQPKKVLDEMLRVLTKNGILILISAAYDFPASFPPAILNSSLREIGVVIIRKIIKSMLLFMGIQIREFEPIIIKGIKLSLCTYKPDIDAVHIVLAEEILRYLSPKIKMQFVRTNPRWRYIPLLRFWHQNLFLVAKK